MNSYDIPKTNTSTAIHYLPFVSRFKATLAILLFKLRWSYLCKLSKWSKLYLTAPMNSCFGFLVPLPNNFCSNDPSFRNRYKGNSHCDLKQCQEASYTLPNKTTFLSQHALRKKKEEEIGRGKQARLSWQCSRTDISSLMVQTERIRAFLKYKFKYSAFFHTNVTVNCQPVLLHARGIWAPLWYFAWRTEQFSTIPY